MLGLSDDHLLKKWFLDLANKRSLKEAKDPIWLNIDQVSPLLFKESITKNDRALISQLLSVLDEQPPYLDYVLLRILAYAKIGNWSRSEKIILDFIEMDPLERIKQTPWRGDNSLLATRNLSSQIMDELSNYLDQKIILDSLFMLIQDFYSDPQLIEKASSLQDLSRSDFVEKLQLKYNFFQAPGFATWVSAHYLTKEKKDLFLSLMLQAKDLRYPWVLLGTLPESPVVRELLAKKMSSLKNESPQVFFHIISSEEMLGVISRLDGSLLKNIKNTKRQFYSSQWSAQVKDYWAMANLIEMGLVNEEFLRSLTKL